MRRTLVIGDPPAMAAVGPHRALSRAAALAGGAGWRKSSVRSSPRSRSSSISSSGCCSRAACRRPRSLLTYQPPLPTYVRDIDGEPVQSLRPRAAGRSSPIDEFPPPLINAFLSAEDKTFFSHQRHRLSRPARRGRRLCLARPAPASAPRGGSTITQQVAKNLLRRQRIFGDPQDPRGLPRAPDRECADQAADPRALPQPDLPRPQRLWRRRRRRAPISTRTSTSSACRRRPISRSCPRAPSNYDPDRHTDRALDAAQLGARRDGAQRLHHRRPA